VEDLDRDGAGNGILQYALADWIGGVIADDFVVLRLLLARPMETQAEASMDLQMRLTKEQKRWSCFPEQNGGLAKVDSGLDYAANFSSLACVA